MGEVKLVRDRQAAAQFAAARAHQYSVDSSAAILAQTVTLATYPVIAQSSFACISLDIDGIEIEGSPAYYVAETGNKFFALNLGKQIPPVGTVVLCHSVGGRWCFRYDG